MTSKTAAMFAQAIAEEQAFQRHLASTTPEQREASAHAQAQRLAAARAAGD